MSDDCEQEGGQTFPPRAFLPPHGLPFPTSFSTAAEQTRPHSLALPSWLYQAQHQEAGCSWPAGCLLGMGRSMHSARGPQMVYAGDGRCGSQRWFQAPWTSTAVLKESSPNPNPVLTMQAPGADAIGKPRTLTAQRLRKTTEKTRADREREE